MQRTLVNRVLLLTLIASSTMVSRRSLGQEEPSSGQKLALYTKPAVVRIYGAWIGEFKFNNRVWREAIGGMGSGFFISPDGYVGTNAHVVQTIHDGEDKAKEALLGEVYRDIVNTYKAEIQKLNQDQIKKLLGQVEMSGLKKLNFVVLPNGDHAAYDIKAYGAPTGEGKDCAIIKIPTRNAPTLAIGDASKVQIQDRIYVIGYPGVADVQGVLDEKSQLEASITDGAISAIKTSVDGDQVLQTSAPITHGNSGGPAINEKGEVVGLATFGNEKEVQGFNFLVSSSTLSEFVRQAGATNTTSETDHEWRAALELYWGGHYTAALEKLQEVEGLFPAHVEAKKLADTARELKREGKEKSRTGLWLILGGALLIALGSGVMLLRMRKGGSRPPVMARPSPNVQNAQSQPQGYQAIPGTVAVGSSSPAAIPATMIASGRVASLVCTRGKLMGQKFALTPEGLLVGRQPGVAHVVVEDGRASGEHVWLRWEDGKLFAIDQQTTNGTFVNDVKRGRVSRVELKDGDTVIVADPDCCSLSVKLS